MADWASLVNSPPPSSRPVICECDGLLLASNDGRGLSKVAEILAHLPIAEIPAAGDQNRSILGHKLNADNTLLSAKSAFLPADSKTATMLTSNGGLYKLFENFLARHEETWWLRFFSSSLAFTLGPSHKMSLEDLIASYSTTRDLNQAPVRCLAWHPHCAKLALALKDDTVQVVTSTSSIKPILKHKKQRQVTCLAWRPFSGSELAVGCASGLLIWNVDPVSVVARPSTACVSILSDGLKHPVTSLAWCPNGTLLLSSSAAAADMYVWNTASEVKVPLKRIGGGGVHLISWSPQGTAVLASTTSTIFRIWSTKNWTPERWNVLGGHINNACWSPCGTTVLFTTSEDAQIFCLRLTTSVDGDIESAGAAVPVMDLAKTVFTMDENQEEVSVGGRVLGMRWDPSGERLVLSFVESNLIALFCTKVTPTGLSISPLGFIPGEAGEAPTAMEFAKHFKGGALLSIAWTSGRLQHMPMFFVSNAGQEVDLASNVCLLSSSPTGPEFAPRIFSSPAF